MIACGWTRKTPCAHSLGVTRKRKSDVQKNTKVAWNSSVRNNPTVHSRGCVHRIQTI